MGSTNSTPNYELSQFIGTDKPAWLQDYNGDMLKIDTGIAGAKTAADNAQSAADGAQGDATTALNDIANINTELGTVENTLSTATGNINTINSLIGNGTPTTTDQTIIGAINEINAEVQILDGYYDKIPNSVEYRTSRVEASVTADGVKTSAELLHDLHTALQAIVDNLDDNEEVEILNCALNDHGYSMNPITEYIYKKGDTVGNLAFDKIASNATNMTFYSAASRADTNSYYYDHTIAVADSAITFTNYSTSVPTSGVHYGIIYQKFSKVSKS